MVKTYNLPNKRMKADDPHDGAAGCEIFAESDSEPVPDCFEETSTEENNTTEVFVQSDSGPDSAPETSGHTKRKGRRSKLKLQFLGKCVCQRAHQQLMQIGAGAIERVRQGRPAFQKREPLPKHPGVGRALRMTDRSKWQKVLAFLWLLYHSQAEVLPTKFKMPSGYLKEGFQNQSDDEDEDFQIRYVQSFLQSLETYHKMPDFDSMGPGTFSGPRRYLQHRKPIDVYNEYVAHATSNGEAPSCLSTFMTVFRATYKDHLKFRNKGEHAECNVCSKMKKNMSRARTQEDRQRAYKTYSAHILSQWVDRQTYWHQRTLSQAWFRPSSSIQMKICGFPFIWQIYHVTYMTSVLYKKDHPQGFVQGLSNLFWVYKEMLAFQRPCPSAVLINNHDCSCFSPWCV